MSSRAAASVFVATAALVLAGCGGDTLDESYGKSRNKSLNGTGVLATLVRGDGHTVRTAVRLTPELDEWADVIIRFATYPGPPGKQEGEWYLDWLTKKSGRRLVYVPCDFQATDEYWNLVIDKYSHDDNEVLRSRATKLKRSGSLGRFPMFPPPKEVADAVDWFAVEKPTTPPQICEKLGGPWGEGLDPAKAALSRHETLKVDSENVLLEGDGKALAMEWTQWNGAKVLVVANGSFLLNAALLNASRRPLAVRVARWVGKPARHVAFVEGYFVVGEVPTQPSVFALLKVPPFGWVVAQLFALGLAACLARAPRLGRPRPEPPSGEDRPAAHPEALGALLAQTGQAAEARALLAAYRRWRNPSHSTREAPSASADDRLRPNPVPESPAHE